MKKNIVYLREQEDFKEKYFACEFKHTAYRYQMQKHIDSVQTYFTIWGCACFLFGLILGVYLV